jgi:hypothetical protein
MGPEWTLFHIFFHSSHQKDISPYAQSTCEKKLLSKSFSKLAHGLIGAWFEKQQKIKIYYACVPLTAPLVDSIWLVNIGVEVITCILYAHHGIKKIYGNHSD